MSKSDIEQALWEMFVREQWADQLRKEQERINEAVTPEEKKAVSGIPHSQFTKEAFWCWWAKGQKEKP